MIYYKCECEVFSHFYIDNISAAKPRRKAGFCFGWVNILKYANIVICALEYSLGKIYSFMHLMYSPYHFS